MDKQTANTFDLRRHQRPVVAIAYRPNEERLRGASEQAEKYGWQLRLLQSNSLLSISDRPPVGAIFDTWPSDPICQNLLHSGCPVIRVGSQLEIPATVPSVLFDQANGGEIVAEYFAGRGFKDIGYIGHTPLKNSRLIYEGLAAGAKKYKLKLHLLQLKSSSKKAVPDYNDRLSWESNRNYQITEWLKDIPKPLGILAYDDFFATILTELISKNNYDIPGEVAIMGFYNIQKVCELAPVALSSVDFSYYEQGKRAVKLLHDIVQGKEASLDPVMIPPRNVVERRSTNILAIKDPRAAKALRYMWDYLDLPLTVEDIAREVDISTSTLERLFRKYLNRGVKEELRRKRLEYACDLLKSTDMTIDEITKAIGFNSKPYLHRTFLKEYGMTPKTYRDQDK